MEKKKAVAAFVALRTTIEEESSSDEELQLIALSSREGIHHKVINYFQRIRSYSDLDFRSHFRLSRVAFEEFHQVLENNNFRSVRTQPGRLGLTTSQCLLITLWTIANQEPFRCIADRFNIGKGCAHTIFMMTCKEISYLQDQYFKWPTQQELPQVVHNFNTLRGEGSFPNVVGCVDGTHIEIRTPLDDNSFIYRKNYASMQLQGICNSNLQFINIFCGWPGSSHDARVWQNSPIYSKLKNDNLLPEEFHLLEDSAYPLDIFLMVPYKDNGHLTMGQKRFNVKLSRSRVVIEQALGRLKGVFRRLKYVDVVNLENFKFIVTSACILHNFILNHNILDNVDIESDNDSDEETIGYRVQQPNVLAFNKRDNIRLRLT